MSLDQNHNLFSEPNKVLLEHTPNQSANCFTMSKGYCGIFNIGHSSNRKLPSCLLPVAVKPNQGHKLKELSRSLTSKIILQTLKFASIDR